ncbi:menaquinone biosynthesis protein [Vicingus serpentipes]|uniref:Chorismate dehydratase n=1 Tax=Vicingus serpentipes TaxID=1926625 RepID=A0A5C6RUU9_9FLAO|nr:menaquinone biosynthesis protein [Vicingus serpentipes]TXB65290.1 menaquinone biosynthesis protein [Vicingus serpentipes]
MKIKISLVSYLNTLPFLYGINKTAFNNETELQSDIPSVCAQKLINKDVDLGLVPVATLPYLKDYHIVSDYCIGAKGKVNSVLLLSDVPLNEIEEVYLDYQSRTSINLTKVLAKNYWNIAPKWKNSEAGYENHILGKTAGVIIGDRTFNLNKEYKFKYDLAEEWFNFTQLPFAFACWVSNKELDKSFIEEFNNALSFGVSHIPESISLANNDQVHEKDLLKYLTEDIDYNLDNDKRKSIQLFLEYLTEITD